MSDKIRMTNATRTLLGDLGIDPDVGGRIGSESDIASATGSAFAQINDLQASVNTADTGLLDRTTALETAVGDASAGLVKDVDDLQASVDTETTGLLDRTTALETTVGDASAGLVKDVDDLQASVDTETTGLLDRATALEAAVGALQPNAYLDYTEDVWAEATYTYDSTPDADASVAIPSEKSYAVITPGGSTAYNLTFALPAAPAGDVVDVRIFKVSYDLGTHTGAIVIGGVTVTGSGILHFFWNGTAWETWTDNAVTLTVPDRSTGIAVGIKDADSANTITVQLPDGASNIRGVLLIAVNLTADSGTACKLNISGGLITSSGLATSIEDVANGVYTLYCMRAGYWTSTWPTGIAVNTP